MNSFTFSKDDSSLYLDVGEDAIRAERQAYRHLRRMCFALAFSPDGARFSFELKQEETVVELMAEIGFSLTKNEEAS